MKLYAIYSIDGLMAIFPSAEQAKAFVQLVGEELHETTIQELNATRWATFPSGFVAEAELVSA